MVRILLVDDHITVAQGTKILIEQLKGYEVNICHSSDELRSLLKREQYDVILLDVNLPNINGIQLSKELLLNYPDLKIILYTGLDLSLHLNIIADQKICGFISKSATGEQLIRTIDAVLSGYTMIPTELFWRMRTYTFEHEQTGPQDVLNNVVLNDRELSILKAISNGLSNREISEHLLISQRSVEYALTSIFTKLGVKSRVEALVKVKTYNLMPEINELY